MTSYLSWMWGKKAQTEAPTTTATPNGMQSNLEAEEVLLKREAHLQRKIAKEIEMARVANQKGNRALAMRHLQKKRQMAEELTRVEGHIGNLSALRMKLEEAQLNVTVFQAHQDAAETFTKLQANIGDVEATLDKVREAVDNAVEVSERLAQPLDAYDEDELLEELMDFELNEQQHVAVAPAAALAQLAGVRVEDADDEASIEAQLRMLQAE